MFWGILNLILSILEVAGLQVCLFCFMRVNSRTIFLKKRWYITGFTLSGLILFASFLFLSENWGAILLHLAMTAALGLLLFHRKLLPIILDVLFLVVLFLGMEGGIFIANIILVSTNFRPFPNPASAGCMFMSLKLITMVFLTIAMIRWKKAFSEGFLTLRQTITVLLLPAFSVFFLSSLIQMSVVYIQLHGIWLILANIIALLLLNTYFLYLFRYLFRVNKLEHKMKLFQIQNELQYRHYEELEQKYRESRKILHDMKNHLQAVEQLYEGENKTAGDAYVKDLYHMINILGEKYYSSNKMLNIILNEKLSQAQQIGIQVKAEIGDADFDDIKDIDITTIFANLLDNAIEAAAPPADTHYTEPHMKTTDTGAWLELKIDTIQDFRVIRIRNSKASALVSDSTTPDSQHSSSTHKKGHMGLGLVNVRHALHQYHGSLEQSETEKEYCISIMIPGKEA